MVSSATLPYEGTRTRSLTATVQNKIPLRYQLYNETGGLFFTLPRSVKNVLLNSGRLFTDTRKTRKWQYIACQCCALHWALFAPGYVFNWKKEKRGGKLPALRCACTDPLQNDTKNCLVLENSQNWFNSSFLILYDFVKYKIFLTSYRSAHTLI